MTDYISSKDALFLLDTDFDEDMHSYTEEATRLTIKHINSTPELYNFVKGNSKHGISVKDSALTWAYNHGDEFGDLFVTELDIVDWGKVEKAV